MIKYYFTSIDGEIYINLPHLVSTHTLLSIMKDCGFSRCYTKVGDVKVIKDLYDE